MSSEKHIMKKKKSTVSFLCATWYFDYGMCVCTIFLQRCVLYGSYELQSRTGREFFFGTDTMGRDLFSCIWHGGRVSLTIGFLSAAISAVIAVLYGTASALSPAWLDRLLMRLVDVLLSVPSLFACLYCAGSIWKKYYRNECSDRTLWMVLNGKNRAHTGKNSKRKWICHGITVHGRRFFSCALLASCPKFSSFNFIYDYYECTNSNS